MNITRLPHDLASRCLVSSTRPSRLFVFLLSVSTALAAGTSGRAAAPGSAVVRTVALETDGAATPLGIDDPRPRLTWQLDAAARGVVQTAWHVLVATRPELLQPGRADVWDSRARHLAGPVGALRRPRACARARATTGRCVCRATRAAPASGRPPTWFETGQLSAGDWKGEWIAGPERKGPLTERRGPRRRCGDSRRRTSSAVRWAG